MELNQAQLQAVETTEGVVRVVASAGSGKTRTIAARYYYMVEELGILPESILCITFTNKAAAEMKARIRGICPDLDTAQICTFHSFANSVLQEDSHLISFPKSFTVLDGADADDLLKMIYEESNLSLKDMTFSKARDMISARKTGTEQDYFHSLISWSLTDLQTRYQKSLDADDRIFYGFLYHQRKTYGLDYDDLIAIVIYLFKTNQDLLDKWSDRIEYLMIDEFQDIDGLQYELMDLMSRKRRNLYIVGDPDQTIYTWRGANIRYFLDFDQAYPDCITVTMSDNYRSAPPILQSANRLIDQNDMRIKKDVIPMRNGGQLVEAGEFQSAEKEAEYIANTILEQLEDGMDPSQIAILYRAHFLSRPIEDALVKAEIPYTITSGIRFFQRREIKDALAYARMLVEPNDLDFLRTVNLPKRNIGKTRIEKLKAYAEQTGNSLFQSLQDLAETDLFKKTGAKEYIDVITSTRTNGVSASTALNEILDRSGYEGYLRLEGSMERLDNLAELKQSVVNFEIESGEENDLASYLMQTAFMNNEDLDNAGQKVRLMTIHSAKGLEFDCVFMAGMNEMIFPSRQIKNKAAMEEERRLCFVGMTRAKDQLYLTCSRGKMHNGGWKIPSRFLLDLDNPAVHWTMPMTESSLAQIRYVIDSKSNLRKRREDEIIFEVMDRVKHPLFGAGTVLESHENEGYIMVHFDKMDQTRRLSGKAKLVLLEKGTGGKDIH